MCPGFVAKMKLTYERKRDSYWKFLLDSHDLIIQKDFCANSDVEMKDSKNNVSPASQPELVQDIWTTVNLLVTTPTFLSQSLILMIKFDECRADTSEIEVNVFEEVIFKKKRKKTKQTMQRVEPFATKFTSSWYFVHAKVLLFFYWKNCHSLCLQ